VDAAGKARKPQVTRREPQGHPEQRRGVTVDIELDGTRRRVALRRAGDGWTVAIDGREVAVSVVETGGGWSMLVGEILPPSASAIGLPERLNGVPSVATADKEGGSHNQHDEHVASGFSRKSYEIAFDATPGGGLIVHVNGMAVPLTVIDPGPPKPWAKAAHRGRYGQAASGPRAIVAPMPGRIVRVLVKPEEAVAARQPLVVVEAMKMENEVRAPRAGTVSEVRVAEGASVEANTVLVVLR
jgi:biotin carboxyl carrier protein